MIEDIGSDVLAQWNSSQKDSATVEALFPCLHCFISIEWLHVLSESIQAMDRVVAVNGQSDSPEDCFLVAAVVCCFFSDCRWVMPSWFSDTLAQAHQDE